MFVEAESQGVCCAVVWGKCSGVACFVYAICDYFVLSIQLSYKEL
jgi:hypothetical protein